MLAGETKTRQKGKSMTKDPVCGMQVDEKTAAKSEYDGQTYYFCSNSCKSDFDSNPARYIRAASEHDTSEHS